MERKIDVIETFEGKKVVVIHDIIFKKKQYVKLFSELNYKVQFIFILSDWFRKDRYKDTRDYIISSGCSYYYNYIPLHELGLPIPNK